MPADKITCPKCHFNFPIESALTEGIESKVRAEFQVRLKESETRWKQEISAKEEELVSKMESERKKLQQQAVKHAREDARIQLESLQEQLAEKKTKLAAAEKKELTLLKKQNQLEEATRNLELEVQRKLSADRRKIQEQAATQAADQHRLKDAEKDKQLNDMKKQIDELKRKAEQGSQQLQGEVLELDLEQQLAQSFPLDVVTAVAKGKQGADITQEVRDRAGHAIGAILWEAKNTRNWSNDWLEKLKRDQRELQAEVCVIISEVLPKGVSRMALIENVWVCERSCALGLATALRAAILDVSAARAANQDRGTKMEQLYTYLSGTEFRQRVDAITEAFASMKDDLDGERRAMERAWAKREKQLTTVIKSTARMYGDLQGIIGAKALPAVKSLELPGGADAANE